MKSYYSYAVFNALGRVVLNSLYTDNKCAVRTAYIPTPRLMLNGLHFLPYIHLACPNVYKNVTPYL